MISQSDRLNFLPDDHSFDSGIGLETTILFAKEGANVLMADISAPALEKALAKVKQLVPNAQRIETQVRGRREAKSQIQYAP